MPATRTNRRSAVSRSLRPRRVATPRTSIDQSAFDVLQEGVLTVGPDGRISYANSSLAELFGYAPGELAGKALEILVPEGLRKQHQADRKAYMVKPVRRQMGHGRELVGRRKDGSEFPVEISLSPIATERGTVVMAMVTDITERKRATEAQEAFLERLATLHEIDRSILNGLSVEETASAAAARLAQAVNAPRVAVLIYDRDQPETLKVVAVEGTGVEITPVGSTVLFAEEPLPLRSISGDRVARRVGSRDKSALGRRMYAAGLRSYVAVPLRVESEPIGMLTVWSEKPGIPEDEIDIVAEIADQIAIALQQARMVEEIRLHATELEERVQERTAELQERNDELQAFAYSVSHDLRAPLRAMHGFGQALLEDYGQGLDPVAHGFVTRIVDAASRMDEIIYDLLEYSRIARSQLTLEAVPLREVTRAAIDQLDGEISAAGAQIDVRGGDVVVLGHKPTLTQIGANLLSNAIKFIPAGKMPEVDVKISHSSGYGRLSVTDNGIGIPAEYQDRIFRLFERLHGMDRYPGTGIGLAIVKKGVDRMGGTIGLESMPDQGTTFWVELPLA